MKTVEIITVRLDPRREEPLLRELRTAIEKQKVFDDRVIVELYRHAALKTDLSIHLRSESLQADGLPSVLGRRLADALKEFGPTSHSSWVECPRPRKKEPESVYPSSTPNRPEG